MGIYAIKMPDIGEGIAEVELVEWRVQPGDEVQEDQVVADVMTDKATVEIPSPVAGKVLELGGKPGELMAVGAELVRIEVAGEGNVKGAPPAVAAAHRAAPARATAAAGLPPDRKDDITQENCGRGRPGHRSARRLRQPSPAGGGNQQATAGHPTARARAGRAADRIAGGAPPRLGAGHRTAVRARQRPGRPHRARGPGRLSRLARAAAAGRRQPACAQKHGEQQVPVIGLRRRIAQKMQEAKRRIPHFSYVEEVDVTELEALRAKLNERHGATRGKLTVLPFIARAVVLALQDFPQMNARFDDDAGVVTRYEPVHLGIATQTESGLMVPVLHHAEAMDLWTFAREVTRLAEATRSGKATREELSGSTITITSLGPLGGIVTTPVINHPEVAIVGVNRIVERPVFQGDAIVKRKLMNLSSSFDHRVVDGMDAAQFVQAIRALLETPALLFVE